MRKCSTLVIKEIQIKTTMKYQYTPTILAKTDNTKCWGYGVGLTGKWYQGTFCGHGDISLDRSLAYTGACSWQNSSDYTLKICHFTGCKFHLKEKGNEFSTLVNDYACLSV